MHVTEPTQFKALPRHHKRRLWIISFVVFLVLAALTYVALLYFRPLPPVNAAKVNIMLPAAQSVSLAWPNYGQAAIGADGFGLLANHGTQTPAPAASTAKLISALAILKQKPITTGQTGPMITLTNDDVDIYNDYYARGGSVVAVEAGEQLNEYQALQAMLLPSANNMADSLARWAFGSTDNYVKYANQLAASLGMNNTHITDASGFSPDTKSTATDMVILAQAALKEPIIMEIAGQKEATIPVEGAVQNINRLLGQDGVVGIKTGNTDEAGGCFVLAAVHTLPDGKKVTIVSAVMGAPTLSASMTDSLTLLKSSYSGFQTQTIMHKNQSVAAYQSAWGSNATAVLSNDVQVLNWIGRPVTLSTNLGEITTPAKSGQQAAELNLVVNGNESSVKAYLNQTIPAPSLKWRLTRN
ncbi:MAG TPA: hypothetical protein VLE69_02110 [Candidatus Saccharimonadales bacterium]|nr:hypothetical protein [Candidatus Saccharimonadales bacterium]